MARAYATDQAHVLNRRWPHLGLGASDDFATTEAIAAITRLVDQIERVLEINQLTTVTKEVVEAARLHLRAFRPGPGSDP